MNTLRSRPAGLRPIVAGTAFFAAAVLGSPAGLAQPASEKPPLTNGLDNDILKARGQELAAIRAEQQRAAESEARLRAEIHTLGQDRRKLNTDLIGTAARLREVEARLSATESRLAPLEDQERDLRNSLKERRGTIAEVLAALQRMGRRPPPALLVSPEDAATTLRSAIVLGAVVPELRERAEKVAADLGALQKLRASIATERASLSADLKTLSDDQRRITLLVDERQKQQSESERALEQSRAQAGTLARQAESLQDLVTRLEQGLDNAARAARNTPEADQKAATRPALVALSDPGRMSPAIAFASARGTLRMPVNGVKIRDFGATDGIGGAERGISVATRPGAQVTSPCDGWVVYAGPFRSYGQLLILNAGGGYHVVLAGMDRISVEIGQFVLTGEPVAVMGSGTTQVATASSKEPGQMGTSQPVLYVEFRKDGTPVDSGPWWAKKESEKVRG
ncbi:MAG: murein hydrolase activator EnvC family protein [Pseudorhodoplanes sp.]